MKSRTLHQSSRRYLSQVRECLISLFALELLHPSSELFLYSAWITDLEIIDNQFGQFRALLPEEDGSNVTLSRLLNVLGERGMNIHVAVRKDRINVSFLERLSKTSNIQYVEVPDLHQKILVTERALITGSMNFTYAGVYKNSENTEFTIDRQRVSEKLILVREEWRRYESNYNI
jgi:hypothetical protein